MSGSEGRLPLYVSGRIFGRPCVARKVAGLLLAVALVPAAGAQDSGGFEAYRDRQQDGFEAYRSGQEEAFAAYRERVREAFAAYKRKAARVWGRDRDLVPDRQTWVSYRHGMRERRVVDFERGQARFQVALEPGQRKVTAQARAWLKDAIVDSLTRGPDQRTIEEIAEDPDAARPGGDPLLDGLAADDAGRPVAAEQARDFAEQVVKEARVEEVESGDGHERVAVTAEVPLIPDHVRKRAEKYQTVVERQAERRSLAPELVFAVMETESFFNPMARSPIPAFGLMQLVPVSGGLEAYRMVHGKDKKPSEQFLYDPQNNVELGAAYLHRLYYDYMRGIEDDRARLWCAVAAYNTGPGNLYRTFAEAGGRQAAVRRVNRMGPDEVFDHLVVNLPYEETRHYIQKVREKMPKYQRL
ncbi:murein transglycosylase domain-containing protein [Thiohalorhabdus sp. Cl-TMA]|uniref:Murein transglycosylase domain-containing protein n=1 Tax=Thiohalorhabdus methylotrophus TaxID=3242694 RepID=A0ABV4TTN2_9GAMM